MSRPAKNEASKSIDKVPRPMRRMAVRMSTMTGREGSARPQRTKDGISRSSLHLKFISLGYSPFFMDRNGTPVRLQ